MRCEHGNRHCGPPNVNLQGEGLRLRVRYELKFMGNDGSRCKVPAKAAEQSCVSVCGGQRVQHAQRFVTSEASEPIGHLGAVGVD